MRKTTLAIVLALASLVPSGAAREPGKIPKPGFNVFSKEQDIQLGREAAAQVRQQVDIVNNEELQSYVRRLGTTLASQPEAGDYPYEFTVVNDRGINAFALPGGPIFIHSGTLAAAGNEAQLAGVIAHEISHVALRHSTNQASKANLIQLPALLASGILGQGSLLSQLGQVGLDLGLNSLLLKYSRTAESQADALGARIMAEAGYNPIEMARFFEKLQAEGASRAPRFLSDHPDPGNRERAIEQEIQTFPKREYTASTGGFASAKRLAASLPPPRAPKRLKEGRSSLTTSVPTPTRPAGPGPEFTQWQARTYSLQYPAAWKAYGGSDSAMVTLAPPQGLVKMPNGGVALGCGAVVNYYFPGGRDGRVNLNSGTQELVTRLSIANRSLRASSRRRRVQVDGRNGLVTYLTAASPYGGSETNVLLTVDRPEGLFYMVFVAPAEDFEQFKPAFEKMLGSIDFRG